MYRVFLAEEDPVVRESIRESLARYAPDFELTGEASDGMSALEMIRDLRPEVLICGMRMPFMDGRTLCRMIRRDFPWIQMLMIGENDVLTSEREARRLGANGYLLRPVSGYELGEMLSLCAEQLRGKERSLLEMIDAAKRGVTEERREVERSFAQWIYGGDEQVFNHRLYLESYQRGAWCRLMLLPVAGLTDVDNVLGLLRILEREPSCREHLAAANMQDVLVMTVTEDDPQKLEDTAYGMAYTVLCMVEHFTGQRVRIRVGEAVNTLEQLRESFFMLRDSAGEGSLSRAIFGRGDDMRRKVLPPEQVTLLSECMISMDEEEMLRVFERYYAVRPVTRCDVRQAIRRVEQEVGAQYRDGGDGDDMLSLRSLLCSVRSWRDRHAPGISRTPLGRARKAAVLGLDKPGLQLFGVACECGISPSRLRQIFLQEMGESFTAHLMRLRLRVAEVLLSQTRMRVSGIAEKTGFLDIKAFADVFFRYAAMTPQEYRRRSGPGRGAR